jgi:8-amino-7-oxononanoate synthase
VKQGTPPALRHLEAALQDLERQGLLRTRPSPVADVARTFCSNDYLGLARDIGGSGAARLIVGERPEHATLEDALARWLGAPAALAFTSGYAANLGVLSSLAGPGDVVVSDRLNHASIIDGCRLSRARVVVIDHLDLDAVARALAEPRQGRAWVVTESYFSMDADGPDLAALRRMCDRADAALVVDEAHALGVYGEGGRGRCAEAGVLPDVLVGTLGKAIGAAGAFVVGCQALVDWLWNRARSFVFSTGMSPLVAVAAQVGIERLSRDQALRTRVTANAAELRRGLRELGLPVVGEGPIIPIVLGTPERAMEAAARLRAAGIHVLAIRPPTVPMGSARLRITVTARHTADDLRHALRAFEEILPWLRSSS